MRRALSSCVGADKAVEEAHRHRLHAGVAQPTHCRAERCLIQRRFHRAVVAHALGHFQAEVARHQRRRLVGLQVVQVGALLPADLQQVAKAVGGDQPGLHAAMLDQRIGRDGRAVAEIANRARPDADLPDTFRHTPCDEPRDGSSGVDGTFQTSTRPVSSSNRQTSVKVPPESTPTRQVIARNSPVIQRSMVSTAAPSTMLRTNRMSPPVDPVQSDTGLPERAGVVIVGGGIIGTCTALFLAEKGHSVVLCEKGRIGGEQSSRNWGWCRTMGRDAREIPLAMESLRLWRGMNTRTNRETGFRQAGIAYLCETEKEIAAQEAWLAEARQYQVDARLLRGAAIDELVPGASSSFIAALHTPTDGRAEPSQAAPAIAEAARAARRHGADRLRGARHRDTGPAASRGVVTEKRPHRLR